MITSITMFTGIIVIAAPTLAAISAFTIITTLVTIVHLSPALPTLIACLPVWSALHTLSALSRLAALMLLRPYQYCTSITVSANTSLTSIICLHLSRANLATLSALILPAVLYVCLMYLAALWHYIILPALTMHVLISAI